MIHCLDTDPRQYTDPNYLTNYGSFSIVSRSLNEGLKEIGYYSDIKNAKFVGISDGLNLGFRSGKAAPFIIHVFDCINTLPIELLNAQKSTGIKIIGLSKQVSGLWQKFGVKAEYVQIGTDTNFYHQISPKNEKFTILCDSHANVRAGVEMAVQAYDMVFCHNNDVQLIIKNTLESKKLEDKIREYQFRGNNIQYINKRISFEEMRQFYSQSHILLAVFHHSSWGLSIHQAAACNCLPIVGDFCPSNTMFVNVLLKPNKIINISEKLDELVGEWGLHNAYPMHFNYLEPMQYYDYSIYEYADLLSEVYFNWKIKYSKIDTKLRIANEWTNKRAAEQLVSYLSS